MGLNDAVGVGVIDAGAPKVNVPPEVLVNDIIVFEPDVVTEGEPV